MVVRVKIAVERGPWKHARYVHSPFGVACNGSDLGLQGSLSDARQRRKREKFEQEMHNRILGTSFVRSDLEKRRYGYSAGYKASRQEVRHYVIAEVWSLQMIAKDAMVYQVLVEC